MITCHNFICFHLLDPWAHTQKLFRLILFIYTKVKYSNSSYFQTVVAIYVFEIHMRPNCLHHNNHFILTEDKNLHRIKNILVILGLSVYMLSQINEWKKYITNTPKIYLPTIIRRAKNKAGGGGCLVTKIFELRKIGKKSIRFVDKKWCWANRFMLQSTHL